MPLMKTQTGRYPVKNTLLMIFACLLVSSCATPPLMVDQATLDILPEGAGWLWLQSNASRSSGLLCEFDNDGRTVNMRYSSSSDRGRFQRNLADGAVYASRSRSDVYIYNRVKAYGVEVWVSTLPGLRNPADVCIFEIIGKDAVEPAAARFRNIATAARNAGISLAP